MNPFTLTIHAETIELRLAGEVTIADAGPLHAALVAALTREHSLVVAAGELARLDTAVVQLLVAAARHARAARLTTTTEAWGAAFAALGLTDPFSFPDPSQLPTP